MWLAEILNRVGIFFNQYSGRDMKTGIIYPNLPARNISETSGESIWVVAL